MSTLSMSQADTRPSLRILSAILGAGLITFLLFVLMDVLTRQESGYVSDLAPIPLISPVFNKQEAPPPVKKELPEPPKPKPRPETVKVSEPLNSSPVIDFTPDGYTPPTNESTRISLGNLNNGEGDVRPIVRTTPRYPIKAAQDGIEGWVKLAFSIEKDGSVSNIKVIDAQPRSTFDREARRALAKWKYKPQIVNGEAVVRHGLQVMLAFNLDKT